MSGPITIVSVTQLAVERDSRTLKQATSFARLGYRSIVVQGEAGRPPAGALAFELITMDGALPPWGSQEAPLNGAGQREAIHAPVANEAPPLVPKPASPGETERVDPLRRAWRALRRARANAIPWLRNRTYPLRWQLAWNRRAYRSLPEADLYVLHGYGFAPAVLAKSLRTRTPIVYDAHDAYFEITPAQQSPTVGERAWSLVERLCVWRARRYVTVSHGVAQMLEERFGRRPAVIRNCHDLRLDEPAQRDLRGEAGVGEKVFLLVSIGNNKEGMNVEAALEALAQLDEQVHLAFVGRGHESTRELAERRGVSRRVHLVGHVPPTEVASFVRGADAAAVIYRPLTRSYESALPNGFFQGLAAGLPTLYPTRLPELAALAESHGLGLPMDPTDPASIAGAARRLLSDPDLRRELRENADRAGRAESWGQEENLLVDVIEGAIGRRASAGDRTPAISR